MTTFTNTWAGSERACAQQSPVTIGARRYRVTGLGTCPPGRCTAAGACPGLLDLHTDDTGPVMLALPAMHAPPGLQQEYRLEIVTDPDPDAPAALVWFRADGIAAAIAQGRRMLAALEGPDDRYGELYQRNGEFADYLTTLHQGA